MKLTPEEKLTIDAYNAGAQSWAEAHSDINYWVDEFPVFKKNLPKGKILEIGCGGGRDAQVLISLGYDYIGTDIAKKFVQVAKKNNPGARFLVRSIYDLGFPPNSFDGFWASAVFLHIPKSRIDKALNKVHQVIRPGGVGFIAIKQGQGEKSLEEESSDGEKYKRLWSLYLMKEFGDILERNGYEIICSKIKPLSARTVWLIYFVKVVK